MSESIINPVKRTEVVEKNNSGRWSMAALRFGDAFRPPPLPPVTPRAPTPTRKMSMLLSSSRFMSLIVTSWACSWSCKLIDELSFWESDEMGKQRTKRKKMNNAIHPLSIADLRDRKSVV